MSYLRVRALLSTARREQEEEAGKVEELLPQLWVLGTTRVEEEGECEDGVPVVLGREARTAEYCTTSASRLRHHLKAGKERLVEDCTLYTWRGEVLRLGVEQFLERLGRRVRGEGVEGRESLLYTPQEELRLALSVLFKFLRKDVEDGRVVKDLRGWTDGMVALLHSQATLYDHLFLLNHIMRCPAGVGRCSHLSPSILLLPSDGRPPTSSLPSQSQTWRRPPSTTPSWTT